jgi:hypothetical protein
MLTRTFLRRYVAYCIRCKGFAQAQGRGRALGSARPGLERQNEPNWYQSVESAYAEALRSLGPDQIDHHGQRPTEH